jgi:hypothetical protein
VEDIPIGLLDEATLYDLVYSSSEFLINISSKVCPGHVSIHKIPKDDGYESVGAQCTE